jgi:hypothetical protein
MRGLAQSCWLGLALLSCSAPAIACSVVIDRQPSPAEERRDARRAIETASAVIDGEVVQAGDYSRAPALVYAHRVFKEPPDQRWFKVGTAGGDSCAISLERAGDRLRMILDGGPQEYVLFRDGSHAEAEDRILKSDRRKEYPYFNGPQAD